MVTHAGTDIGLPDVTHCTPAMAEEVLDEVGPDKLVLAHMGGWQMWDDVLNRLCGRDVYFDTAFSYGQIDWREGTPHRWQLLDGDMFKKIVAAHGSDKILFGTDSPWSDQKQSCADIEALDLKDVDKNNIFENNARKLLGLKLNF